MWEFYNNLIDKVPENIRVKDFVIGSEFAMVITDYGAGISHLLCDKRFSFENDIKINMSLKDLCTSIKSWNFIEASLGLAAINSYYNQNICNKTSKVEKINHHFISMIDDSSKKIAVVEGNLKNKNKIKFRYDVDFFNRKIEEGDYNISAYGYLVENYDSTYLGGDLIINKHLIKIANDSLNKESVICDISTPISSAFKKIGIKNIGGFVVEDIDKCFNLVKISAPYEDIEKTGKMMKIVGAERD